jgi:hypothetical protein
VCLDLSYLLAVVVGPKRFFKSQNVVSIEAGLKTLAFDPNFCHCRRINLCISKFYFPPSRICILYLQSPPTLFRSNAAKSFPGSKTSANVPKHLPKYPKLSYTTQISSSKNLLSTESSIKLVLKMWQNFFRLINSLSNMDFIIIAKLNFDH